MERKKEYKKTNRTDKDKKNLTLRLSKIEGQVRGIKRMIAEDKSCEELLIQLRSIEKAMKSISNEVIKDFMMTHVVEEVQKGNIEILKQVDEYYKTLQ